MATDITKAVQWLETNLPALKALAAESEKVGDKIAAMRAEATAVARETGTLKAQRDRAKTDLEATMKVAEGEDAKRVSARAAAEKVATSRLEDLQRQQKAYEDQLVMLRLAFDEHERLRILKEQEHEAAVKELEQRGLNAAAELLRTQEKIKALHAHLAGTPA